MFYDFFHFLLFNAEMTLVYKTRDIVHTSGLSASGVAFNHTMSGISQIELEIVQNMIRENRTLYKVRTNRQTIFLIFISGTIIYMCINYVLCM